VRLLVAFREEPLANLSGNIGLGAPDQPPGGDLRNDPVRGAGRTTEQLDLVGVLDHAQLADDARRGDPGGLRSGGLEAQQVHRPQPVGHSQPAVTGVAQHELVRIVGLLPRAHLERCPDLGLRRGALEAGRDEHRVVAGRHDEHRQALQRHRPIAGQVLEIRANADQDRGEVARGHQLRELRQPLRVSLRRDHRRPGTEAASQAASVAGPSSNSFR
jgi:hypothetical protein